MDFVLIPGAGGASQYWERVVPLLEKSGHRALAIELPGADPDAGLSVYADLVVQAIGARRNVILVAQSLGGFTAALVCERVPVGALVFVNAMVPKPGETAGEWGANTRSAEAREAAAREGGYSPEFSVDTYFLHDLPPELAKAVAEDPRTEAESIFDEPCTFEHWPQVQDRLFPLELQARVARERLGKELEVISGGHLVALSNPRGLAKRLLRGLG